MAFNVGLYLVFAYTMLEAANAITLGYLVQTVGTMAGFADVHDKPFIVLTIVFLAWLNYRGVYATLTVNLVLTAIAFIAIVILFAAVKPWSNELLDHKEMLNGLPYGWLGVIASLHFGLWYYLGIEGTCQAAEEVRSPARSLPLGTMTRHHHSAHCSDDDLVRLCGVDALGISRSGRDAVVRRRSADEFDAADGSAVRRNGVLDVGLGQWLHQRRVARVVLDGSRPLSADVVRRGPSEEQHARFARSCSWCRSLSSLRTSRRSIR